MDATLPKTSRPKRKSIAHQPSSATNSKNQDNATADIAALQRAESIKAAKKKLRGKSLGPGGLEALKEVTGNAMKVCLCASTREHHD
jgi:kinetochore protein Spc7/SPC105